MPISLLAAEELEQLIERSPAGLCIVDTRPLEEFASGHIPGAIHIVWEEWCASPPAGLNRELSEPGYWGRLIDADENEISRRLSAYGISHEKTIVVYADGFKSKGREGCIAWMLLYFGGRDVRLLNGGYRAWLRAGGAVERSLPSGSIPCAESASAFLVCRDERRRILLDHLVQLMENEPRLVLLDTRSHREYSGNDYRYMPRMGSLPQAKLLPYASIFNADGTFAEPEKVAQLLCAKQHSEKKLVAFCEVGVRACTVALLLEAYTGIIVAVYDGSMMEWGAHPQLPISVERSKSPD